MNYLNPQTVVQFPNGLSFEQFVQTVLVGISGLPGTMVRRAWQRNAPTQPAAEENWISYGVETITPNANAFLSVNQNGETQSQRMQEIELRLQIYGPNCEDIYGVISDGFQLPQNRFALYAANMGFKDVSQGRHLPDLVNQLWVDRLIGTVLLTREVQRVYPVLTFVSLSGTIYMDEVSTTRGFNFSVT